MVAKPDLVVIHEHPEWQKPLFAALERRGIAYAPSDLKHAAFSDVETALAPLCFNQASPSAYVRGNTRRCRWHWPACERSSGRARAC